MLTITQLKDIHVLLGRVDLKATEAAGFVKLVQSIEQEIVALEKKPEGALAGAIGPQMAAAAVASSETTKPTRKLRRAIATVVKEAQKQQEAAQ
jgi:hypothetical protein